MKRFKKGVAIKSLDELVMQDFIFWHGKIYHRGWFMSWQMRWVKMRLLGGEFYTAVCVEVDDDNTKTN